MEENLEFKCFKWDQNFLMENCKGSITNKAWFVLKENDSTGSLSHLLKGRRIYMPYFMELQCNFRSLGKVIKSSTKVVVQGAKIHRIMRIIGLHIRGKEVRGGCFHP